MFGSLGFPEIMMILVLALLLFGPKRLPEIGRTLGRAMGEFRRSTNELKRSIETEVTLDEVGVPTPERPRRPESAAAVAASPVQTEPRQPEKPASAGPAASLETPPDESVVSPESTATSPEPRVEKTGPEAGAGEADEDRGR